eukprot:scaffold108304_cov52-Attheya_sp.AAC.1
MVSLPSPVQAHAINAEEWKSCVSQVLQYAVQTTTPNDASRAVSFLTSALQPPPPSSPRIPTPKENDDDDDDDDDTPYSIVVDAIWWQGCLLEPVVAPTTTSTKEEQSSSSFGYERLVEVVQGLAQEMPSEFVKRMQVSLEPSLLHDASSSQPSGENHNSNRDMTPLIKRIRKVNTDLFYRQHKFNLLQEESQGYAKLIRLLTGLPNTLIVVPTTSNPKDDDDNDVSMENGLDTNVAAVPVVDPKQLIWNVRELIGTFDLDPNRTSIPHLMGFKFTSHHHHGQHTDNNNTKASLPVAGAVPRSLYVTASFLAAHGLMDTRSLLPHLISLHTETSTTLNGVVAPAVVEDTIHKQYEKRRTEELKELRKMGIVRLNAAAASTASSNGKPNETETTTTLEPKELSLLDRDHPFIRMMETLIQMGLWEFATQILQDNDDNDDENNDNTILWSKLCFLLPNVLGTAICTMIKDWVSDLSKARLPDLAGALLSSSSTSNSEGTTNTAAALAFVSSLLPEGSHPLTSQSCVSDLLQLISAPLRAITECGVIQSDPVLYCHLCRLMKSLITEDHASVTKTVEDDVVSKELRDGQTLELGLLRTLLKTAGGYGFADSASSASLSKVNQKSSRQVRTVLQSDDMGVTLLILLAQIQPHVLFTESKASKHIKLIGNSYDTCQIVFGLLLEFLTDSSEEEEQVDNSSSMNVDSSDTTKWSETTIAKFAASLPTL